MFWLDDHRWWPYVPVLVAVVDPTALVALGFSLVSRHARYRPYGDEVVDQKTSAPKRLLNARDVGMS